MAQVTGYTFSSTLGTYTEITGGTVVATATGTTGIPSIDDVIFAMPDGTIPFDFYFNGALYSGFNISSNGFITFGATPPATTTYLPISVTVAYNGALSAVGRDLQGAYGTTANTTTASNVLTNVAGFAGVIVGRAITGTGIPANATITAFDAGAQTITISDDATATGTGVTVTIAAGEIRYEVLGSAPNRVFVIQYKNFRKFAGATDNFNFQIRLYETTSTVETVYGAFISNATSTTVQTGLRGLTNADFNNRSTTTDWSASIAGATNTASMTLSATVFPASGLTFTWTSPNFGPSISYAPLGHTALFGSRNLDDVLISDAGGVAGGGFAPRVYWRVNTGGTWQSAATSSGSSPYDFIIGTAGLVVGDTVNYFVVAQDLAGLVTANPSAGFSATDVNTILTYPTSPNFYFIVGTALTGDYTVGVALFRSFSGKDITFEKRVRTIEIEEIIVDQVKAEQTGLYEETLEGTVTIQEPASEADLVPVIVTRTVEQEYYVPILNGEEYEGSLLHEFTPEQIAQNNLDSRGVYITIGAAINDVTLRGVSGPVRFLLVDATYPTETFPIVFGEITGASSTNTISLLPQTGVTSTITGSLALPIFDLNGASYIIFDGRQNGVGTTNSLSISNTSTAANAGCIRFINGSTNNILRYLNLASMPSSSTTRIVEFAVSALNPDGNSDNLITNCDMNGGRYGIYFNGTAANPNMNNVIRNSKIYDATFTQFYMITAASNTTIEGNEIYNVTLQTTANSAINLLTGGTGGVNNIVGNKIYDMQNTSTSTVRGISGTPAAGSTLNILNNFISLTNDNGTKTSIYAIQISGTTEFTANIYYNTMRLGGIHTGGTAGTIISGGLIKSNTGATSVFNSENNISINNRSGGTAGTFHTNFFAGSTNLVGTLDIDYNVWFADGGAGAFHSGWGGFVFNDIQAYRDSAAPHEQHTIFKDVEFVSGIDLHLAGLSLGDADLAGVPVAGITVDIDGDLRDLINPYRGADEGNIPFLPILAPANLVAIPDTFTVDLGWSDNSNNEAGYIIQRKDGDSLSVNPFVTIDTVGVNVINYLDSGLNPNTTYTWRIFGYNALGSSGYSNMAEATTFIPVELTAFTAELSGREVLVSWATATELNNRGFDIERKMESEWEKIGFKDGKGTTTEESYYSFIDKFTYESFVGTITYRLKQMDFDGTYAYSSEVEVNVDFTPKEYTLYQNYPNPFNPVTTIKYSLPFESNVRIAVYNILGEMLDVLVDETKAVGFHDFNWNASNLASGIYIYTIEANSVAGDKNYSSVKKMILMK